MITGCRQPLRWALVLLIGASSAGAVGRPPLVHYTVESGLPSSVVYWITQDRRGFIWFATDSGLARFDGRRFERFTIADGLPTNIVLYMEEDREGNLLYLPFRAQPFVFDGNDLRSLEVEGIERVVMNRVFVDSRDRTWLTGWETHCIEPDGSRRQLAVTGPTNAAFEDGEGHVWAIMAHGFVRLTEEHVQMPLEIWSGTTHQARFLRTAAGQLVYQDGDGLVSKTAMETRRLEVRGLPPQQLNRLFQDSRGDVWLGGDDGLFHLPAPDPWNAEAAHLLPGRLVTCIHEDRERNLWISTRNDGAWFLSRNARAFTSVDSGDGLPPGAVTALGRAGDTVLVGCHSGDLFALSNDAGTLPELVGNSSSRIRSISSGSSPNLIVSDLALHVLEGGSLRRVLMGTLKDACFADRETLLVATSLGLHRVPLDAVGNVRDGERIFDDRCYAVEADGDAIWVGTTGGLFRLSSSGAAMEQVLDASVVDIVLDGERLWVCTAGDGVHVLGEEPLHLTEADGLASDGCRRLHVDEDGHAWVATNSGIDRVHPDRPGDLQHFSVRDGLASDDVNDVLPVRGRVHAATFRGLSIFDPKALSPPPVAPLLHVRRMTIGGVDVAVDEEHALGHGHGPVVVEFVAPSFDGVDGAVRHEYRFAEDEAEWQSLQEPSMTLSRLGPGKQVIDVRAVDRHGTPSETVRVSLTVAPAWWQTWWLQLGVVLAVAGAAGLVVRQRGRRVEQESRIAALQGRALQLQMNPHFVFNCMNALQGLIARGEKERANQYVASFGLLMRKILTSSRERSVPLADVVEVLKLYLELSQRRFQGRLSWKLHVDEEIDDSAVHLPPMLVQPLVENAVEHGLARRGGEGHVQVSFCVQDESLRIEVLDDGVGRNETRRASHRPAGLAITRERLELLAGGAGRLEIDDLRDDAGEPCGTRVRLFLPVASPEFRG